MKKFTELFPVPKFLEMRPAGLSFSSSAARAIALSEKGAGLALQTFGERGLPSGAIVDGSPADKTALIEVARDLRRELGLQLINLSIPDDKAYVFTVKLPKEIGNARQAVELRLEENVPLKAEETVFDYTLIKGGPAEECLASVLAIPSKEAADYVEIAETAGLLPVGLTISADTTRRAIVPDDSRGVIIVANLGAQRATLSIVSRGIFRFTIRVPIESLSSETTKLTEYWQSHRPDTETGTVESLTLCGEGAAKAGLAEELSLSLSLPVSPGNVWQNAFPFDKVIPAIPREQSLSYAGAIGAALM